MWASGTERGRQVVVVVGALSFTFVSPPTLVMFSLRKLQFLLMVVLQRDLSLAVSCQQVNVAFLVIRFQHIFEGLLLALSSTSFYQFGVKYLLGKTLVWHSYHMAAPPELILDDVGFEAG